MPDFDKGHGGVRAFLPFALPVLGAALGVFYATMGTGNTNPLIAVVIGVILGRLAAVAIGWIADRAGSGR